MKFGIKSVGGRPEVQLMIIAIVAWGLLFFLAWLNYLDLHKTIILLLNSTIII